MIKRKIELKREQKWQKELEKIRKNVQRNTHVVGRAVATDLVVLVLLFIQYSRWRLKNTYRDWL